MKKYKPNFNDPRVANKCRRALGWATCQLHEHKYNGWSRKHLDKRIGYSHTDLGRYLRQQLLITHDNHWSMDHGICKKYTLNVQGAVGLAQQLGIEYKRRKPRQSIGLALAREQYQDVFDRGVFEYTEKSGRLYNELQNIKTDIRAPLFASYGFRFNYDIANAYPTLLTQYALQTATYRKQFHSLSEYCNDPCAYRLKLAHSTGTDYATAKKILVAKFNGATLREGYAISQTLNRTQMHRLKHNTQWNLLCKDITRLWKGIARSQGRTRIPPRERMHLYCQEERRVIGVIERQFKKQNYQMFLEHDGWRATDWIDPHLLELSVRKHTGYAITITCEVCR